MSETSVLPHVSMHEEHYQQFQRSKTDVSLKKTSIRNSSPSKSINSARTSKRKHSSSNDTTFSSPTSGKSIWDKLDYRTLTYEQVSSINWLKYCQIKPIRIPLRLRSCFLINKCELRMSS